MKSHPFAQMLLTISLDSRSAASKSGDELLSFHEERINVGATAPDFTLPSQSEEMVNLSDFSGNKPVVLFFYPKDDTLGCTKEVCAFRDSFEDFRKLDAEVIGISSDSVKSTEALQGSTPYLSPC
jgi:peroxiredoxin